MKSNWILPLSLVLNVALLAFGGFALHQDHERPAAANLAAPPPVAALPPQAREISQTAPAPEVQGVQWSDLVSSDDAIYVRNLRAIGCPEATIRDILTAAIGHRYDQRRQDLVVQHQEGRIDLVAMQAAVAQTWEQQNDSIKRLPVAVATVAAAAPVANGATPSYGAAPAGGASSRAGGAGVSIAWPVRKPVIVTPLAVADPPESLGLNEAQAAAVARVGDNFADAVGSQNLAPTDPAYHQLWHLNQQEADDAVKAQIGSQAFVQWQIQNRQTQGARNK